MKKPNIAVVGCGYWGKNLIRNFHNIGALSLVCDGSEEGRNKSQELVPDVEVCDDYYAMLTRNDVDAVVLATPAETHCEFAIRAMEAGKDVFVEKPLALNHQEGLRMKEVSVSTGRILMVGHLLEYHPAVLKLRELLDDDKLGQINYIYSNRLNFGKVRTEENALWSFAPHDIAVILRLVGDMPLEVTCSGGSYITPGLADVTVSCLKFPSGVRAHIFVSWLNPFKEQKLVVMGSKNMAVFNDVAKDDKLLLYPESVEMENNQPVLRKEDSRPINFNSSEPLRNECEHFIECIMERKEPLTDAENGVRVLRVLEACQRSLQLNGNPVSLSDIN